MILPFSTLLPFGIFGETRECFLANLFNCYNVLWQFYGQIMEDFVLVLGIKWLPLLIMVRFVLASVSILFNLKSSL